MPRSHIFIILQPEDMREKNTDIIHVHELRLCTDRQLAFSLACSNFSSIRVFFRLSAFRLMSRANSRPLSCRKKEPERRGLLLATIFERVSQDCAHTAGHPRTQHTTQHASAQQATCACQGRSLVFSIVSRGACPPPSTSPPTYPFLFKGGWGRVRKVAPEEAQEKLDGCINLRHHCK